MNNNHYDAIPKTEEESNDKKEDVWAVFLEEQQAGAKPIINETDSNPQEITPTTTQTITTRPARQSTIQNFFTAVTTKNQKDDSRIGEEKDSDEMDCSTLEDERKRKREQRDYHDSADDMLEKISKGMRATNASSNRPTLLRLTDTPTQNQDSEQIQLASGKEYRVRIDNHDTHDPPEAYHHGEEPSENHRNSEQLEDESHPAEAHSEPSSPNHEDIPTQYTDTLTWNNEEISSDWTEAQVQLRQQRFDAVSVYRIQDRQSTLECNTQEAINDIFLSIHNDMMLGNGSEQPPTQQSHLDDSDYTPSSLESPNTYTQSSSTSISANLDSEIDRAEQLLADIKRFRTERQGLTKDIPSNEAQVNEWGKRNITHLEEFMHFTESTGTLLNLLSPDTIEEYGQLLIIDATVVWLANATNKHPDSRVEAWYTEISNEGINTKMRHARATSRTNWQAYNWGSDQDTVTAWLRIPPKKRVKMAILTTLPGAVNIGQENMIKWITKKARNQPLTKLLIKADWEELAGMKPDQWQSLLQC